MEVRIEPLKQKAWTAVWFNLLSSIRGGEPFPAQPRAVAHV